MKILLFAPPFELSAKEDCTYPLALGFLGAVLEKEKVAVKVYDFLYEEWDKVRAEFSEIIKAENPDVIGISSMTTNRWSAFEMSKIAKAINPKIIVIMGGVHPTIMWHQILKNFPVDFIVIGEGEHTIVELVRAIKAKKPRSFFLKIKGIAFEHNGEVVKTEQRPFIPDLDTIPFPKHEYFENKIKKSRTVFITTSRGCPIGCTFCSTSKHWGRIRRQRGVKSVITEIKQVKLKFPFIKHIYFQDDEFIMNHEWIKEFCDVFIKEGINLTFASPGRVTSVDDEIISRLKEAGCIKLYLGAESGSQKIINSIEKKITTEQIIKAFNICKKHHLEAGIYLMVGLPGENEQTINETIKMLQKIPNAQLGFPSLFQVYPGTQVYDNLKQKRFINDSYWITNEIAPFHTLEHSKRKLFFWALKIGLYSKYYQGQLLSFIFGKIKSNLKIEKIKKQIKKYIK